MSLASPGACLKWTMYRLACLKLSMGFSASNLFLENRNYSSKIISFLINFIANFFTFYDIKDFEILLAMQHSIEKRVSE